MNNIYDLPKSNEPIRTKRYRYDRKTSDFKSSKSSEPFIKGPINLSWISQANALPGKAGPIGLALWYLAGLTGSLQFKLSGKVMEVAACSRKALYSGITSLEEAGLIKVSRQAGAYPEVEILIRPSNIEP